MASITPEKLDSQHHETKDEETSLPTTPLEALPSGLSHHKSREERRLVLKQDLIIIPLLSLGYFFGYLDRGQIGNARLMGMPHDLSLTAQQYFNALMIFFVGYLIAELPIALLMRIVPAQFVFGGAILVFGLCSTLIAFSGGYAGLMVLRTLLGLGEAVLTLGFLYLSLWYKPDELAFRSGLLYCSTPVAGFASGLIAYGVAKDLEGSRGYHSWQWLFMIEGFPTLALGLLVLLLLPSFPDRVSKNGHVLFRSPREREIMLSRMASGQNTVYSGVVPKQILVGLKDPKTWLGSLMVSAPAMAITAFVIFLPTFMKEFGFSKLDAQLYSIIPYAFAIVSTPTFCYVSDRLGQKAMPMLFCLITTIIGLLMLLATTNKVALIAGCCFITTGAYPAIGIGASWITSMRGGYSKRSTAFGVCQIFIQGYSIVGTQVYNNPPRFYKGHGALLGLTVLAVICTLVLYFWLKKQNRERDAAAETRRDKDELDLSLEKSFEELYDYHPNWRYPV